MKEGLWPDTYAPPSSFLRCVPHRTPLSTGDGSPSFGESPGHMEGVLEWGSSVLSKTSPSPNVPCSLEWPDGDDEARVPLTQYSFPFPLVGCNQRHDSKWRVNHYVEWILASQSLEESPWLTGDTLPGLLHEEENISIVLESLQQGLANFPGQEWNNKYVRLAPVV